MKSSTWIMKVFLIFEHFVTIAQVTVAVESGIMKCGLCTMRSCKGLNSE